MSEAERSCPVCGERLVRGVKPQTYKYKEAEAVLNIAGQYCTKCGEGVLEGADLRASELGYAEFKARHDGVLSPNEVGRIREHLALSQQDAGRLLGGGKMMFSKYENGRAAPSVAMSNLLRLLDRHPQLLAELQGFAPESAEPTEKEPGPHKSAPKRKRRRSSRAA